MHFNLTYGSPVNSHEHVSSLVNENEKFSYDLHNTWDEADVFMELHSQ